MAGESKELEKPTSKLDNEASTSLKKIKSIENEKKDNVIDFYISTNETEEQKVRVLIDFGTDLNFIHPDFAKLCGIKLEKICDSDFGSIKEPFFKGRYVRTINDSENDSDSDSDKDDSFMIESDNEFDDSNSINVSDSGYEIV
ncbi:hypothetical protein PIROE2DRAFT_56968 [Piromyces sp. E2]|nr:hypothetical protein PIROE2DRAFT_56968 [Piromyces sp. E2]|eukprot:OUM70070.1 hypothetical protein PIROE2DRAFT_56968 [Piromyces sp. E2]